MLRELNLNPDVDKKFNWSHSITIIIAKSKRSNTSRHNGGADVMAGYPVRFGLDMHYAGVNNIDVKGIQLKGGVAFKF